MSNSTSLEEVRVIKLPLFLSSNEVYFLQREEVMSIYSMGEGLSLDLVNMLPCFLIPQRPHTFFNNVHIILPLAVDLQYG